MAGEHCMLPTCQPLVHINFFLKALNIGNAAFQSRDITQRTIERRHGRHSYCKSIILKVIEKVLNTTDLLFTGVNPSGGEWVEYVDPLTILHFID